jgi:hypothetical protein
VFLAGVSKYESHHLNVEETRASSLCKESKLPQQTRMSSTIIILIGLKILNRLLWLEETNKCKFVAVSIVVPLLLYCILHIFVIDTNFYAMRVAIASNALSAITLYSLDGSNPCIWSSAEIEQY